jgi:uncharacterized protein (TIGR00255 family)
MYSMTGFGKAEVKSKLGTFTVEMNSVNNRYLELSPRLPRQFFSLESRVREEISSMLSRGKVHIYVAFDEPQDAPGRYRLNRAAARAYYQELEAIHKELGLVHQISLQDLLILPDVTSSERLSVDEEEYWPPLQKAIAVAVAALVRMRKREGATLAKDMRQRLKKIETLTRQVEIAAPKMVETYRDKIRARIQQLMDAPVPDQERLEEEIALHAEKTDVAEECVRLRSHIGEYRRALGLKEPSGKRLNFILQEMNREANTIASKTSLPEIAATVISIKEEIERLREQVQNVE